MEVSFSYSIVGSLFWLPLSNWGFLQNNRNPKWESSYLHQAKTVMRKKKKNTGKKHKTNPGR